MDKRKTGIALLITLMSIATIMSIMAVSFSYLDKARKSATVTSAVTQANILYGSTKEILKRFFPKKADNNLKLKMIYSMPLMISEEQTGFAITLTCQPLMLGVPINWLDEEKTASVPAKNSLAKEVFTHIVDYYQIEDPNGLEEMILEAITGKILQNSEETERLKKQKGIISKKHFKKILINYAFRYDDIKVLTIPWEKYFSFVAVDSKLLIDGAYPSAEFVSAAFEIPLEMVQESWIMGETTLASFLDENSIVATLDKKVYAKKSLNAMSCEQNFLYGEKRYGFSFNYIEGRSSNFEFNGQE